MIIIPVTLESYRSLKDKSLKITFETNELNPQEFLGINENIGSFGYLAFKKEPFGEAEKKVIEDLETEFDDKKKTDSQRLRSVLYLLWQNDNEGFDTSVKHYAHHMEKIINHFKSKLP